MGILDNLIGDPIADAKRTATIAYVILILILLYIAWRVTK